MGKIIQLSAAQLALRALGAAEFVAADAYDQTCTDRDASLMAVISSLDYVPGKPASADAVTDYNAYRVEWITGYMSAGSARKIDEASAGRAWTRAIARAGIVKPQSAEALKKQALRDATRAADKANPAGKPEPKSTAGATAAGMVKLELASIEAHLINMLRAGKFAQCHEALRDMEAKTAKM